MAVYTLGTWRVTAGRADEFVAAWRALAEATKRDFPDATAVLLRDRDDPNLFISVGPWDSVDSIAAWRASDGFQTAVSRIRTLLERFEPHTMDPVVDVTAS